MGKTLMQQDIFFRAHTVAQRRPRQQSFEDICIWPKRILLFDTETTIDTKQELTFGAYQVCDLVNEKYVCSAEGLLHADDLDQDQLKILKHYAATELACVEIKSFPPKLDLKLHSRSQFVEKVLWKVIKESGMVVGFNLPFDLSRIAVDWGKARNGGWSLILSKRRSRKSGAMEPNPHRPRVCIHYPFISRTSPEEPQEWPEGRFMDLHTFAFALFGEYMGLDQLCKKLSIPGKLDHEPSGKVSFAEINYCRGDVRATQSALNGLKSEFDLHPLDLCPDSAYSPASIAKAYLDAMGVVPPTEKFDIPNEIFGIAMQAYYGGRAECRVRRVSVPVMHTDFKSQYPTVNTLLGNWDALTAKKISFEDATEDVRKFISKITLDDLFKPATWKKLSFFALVLPEKDILPVRTVYNGITQNIGINELSSNTPIWFAGPDLAASVLLSGKIPHIKKAIRMVPHGKQVGLKKTSLRGMVGIDPRSDDPFRLFVEQRERHRLEEGLARFLKVLANAGSYGLFVELNPEKLSKPVEIKVFSGESSFDQSSTYIEKHGRWYFPPLGALITAGGRLLLAMLERGVRDAGGTYLFCDTDSLCIVASENRSLIECLGGTGKLPNGKEAIHALSRKQVEDVAEKFKKLNPYDPTVVPDLLKIETVNFDSAGHLRKLKGYATSAKRYTLHLLTKSKLTIIEPKAHGLGYLYPPVETKDKNDPHWTYEAWDWMLRQDLGLPSTVPTWVDLPAMMRIVLSTPQVFGRLDYSTRPFNFLFCPLIDPVAGYPAGVDPDQCTPITAFTKDRKRWSNAECINVRDGKHYQLALQQSSKLDKLIPQTFGYVLRLYLGHPEAKSLAPDATPCVADTRGVLKRASIVAGELRYVGKETDRRWSEGEDLSLLEFQAVEFKPSGGVVADATLKNKIRTQGIRKTIRETGLSQHTLETILAGKPVRRKTLGRIVQFIQREEK